MISPATFVLVIPAGFVQIDIPKQVSAVVKNRDTVLAGVGYQDFVIYPFYLVGLNEMINCENWRCLVIEVSQIPAGVREHDAALLVRDAIVVTIAGSQNRSLTGRGVYQ